MTEQEIIIKEGLAVYLKDNAAPSKLKFTTHLTKFHKKTFPTKKDAKFYVDKYWDSCFTKFSPKDQVSQIYDVDKVEGEVDWREWIDLAKKSQKLKKKASSSQDYSNIHIKSDAPICLAVVGDTQIGSWGTDYDLFMKVTEEIINTPNLYVILIGDMLQMAIKMRSVGEVQDNLIPPKQQVQILEAWLKEIKHKVVGAVWCNHATMREENVLGWSPTATLLSQHVIYHNHIGHMSMYVNDIEYKIAASHFFAGRSMLNPCHAPMRYMRMEANDRDIVLQGDFHVPGISHYYEGGKERVAMVCGSIQTDSGYAKRFFSLTTDPDYPCLKLYHNERKMVPYLSIDRYIAENPSKVVKKLKK